MCKIFSKFFNLERILPIYFRTRKAKQRRKHHGLSETRDFNNAEEEIKEFSSSCVMETATNIAYGKGSHVTKMYRNS